MTPKLKNVILIGGYSRSGKTSVLKAFKERGIDVASTSQQLDLICSSLICHVKKRALQNDWTEIYRDFLKGRVDTDTSLVDDLQRKDNSRFKQTLKGLSCREFKIYIAESVIVPTQGRLDGLILPMLRNVNPQAPIVAIETIGGEEAELVMAALPSNVVITYVNMRSNLEETNVDSRQLLKTGAELWFSKENWYGSIDCPNILEKDFTLNAILNLTHLDYVVHNSKTKLVSTEKTYWHYQYLNTEEVLKHYVKIIYSVLEKSGTRAYTYFEIEEAFLALPAKLKISVA
jgi:hypothetical protein